MNARHSWHPADQVHDHIKPYDCSQSLYDRSKRLFIACSHTEENEEHYNPTPNKSRENVSIACMLSATGREGNAVPLTASTGFLG